MRGCGGLGGEISVALAILCLVSLLSLAPTAALQRPPNRGDKCDNIQAGNCTTRPPVPTSTVFTPPPPPPPPKVNLSNPASTTPRPLANSRSSPLQLTTSRAPGLITRTTDAIHKALTGVFTYEDEHLDETSTKAYDHHTTAPSLVPASSVQSTSTPTSTTTSRPKLLPILQATTIGSVQPSTSTARATESPPTTPRPVARQTLNESRVQSPEQESEFLSFIKNLMGSIISSRDSSNATAVAATVAAAAANRSTRQPPEPEIADFGLQAGKLVLGPDQQPATNEDLHLLCKLLHRHFNSSTSSNSSSTPVSAPVRVDPTTTTTTTTTTTAIPTTPSPTTTSPTLITTTTTRSAGEQVFVGGDGKELEGLGYQNYLIESVFDYNPRRLRLNESLIEKYAAKLMQTLYNEALKLRDANSGNGVSLSSSAEPASGDYESDDPKVEYPSPTTTRSEMLVKPWEEATQNNSTRGHLHLIYWLLERRPDEPSSRMRLLNASEANELLDLLDHGFIKQQVELAKLNSIQLAAQFKSNRSRGIAATDQPPPPPANHEHTGEPHVIDDTLRDNTSNPKPASGLSLLMDKLTGASFTENLHLYLILFLLALLLVILCCAIPMICCKSTTTAGVVAPPLTASVRRRRNRGPPVPPAAPSPGDLLSTTTSTRPSVVTFEGLSRVGSPEKRFAQAAPGGPEGGLSASEAQKASQDSIWRKLSTTTTTIVKDQSHLIRSDGTLPVSVARDTGQVSTISGGKPSQFEWYSFEDRFEEQQEELRRQHRLDPTADRKLEGPYTLVSDKRSMSKSVQTSVDHPLGEPRQLEFRDRQEARSSDTLTKSELVMLKEKLVPIGQQQQYAQVQRHPPSSPASKQVASQTSFEPRTDYVNQSVAATHYQCTRGSQTDLKDRNNHELSSMSDELQMADASQASANWRPPTDHASVGYIDSAGTSLATSSKSHHQPEPPAPANPVIHRSSSSSPGSHERQAKMRQVELAPKTRAKVEAIKSELGRLERGDTYRRYDI